MAGIYIHIPFCMKLCHYCDFYHVIVNDDKPAFLQSLKKEVDFRKDYLGRETVSTIYLGGGTPSVLSVSEIESLLIHLSSNFNIEKNSEITIEINPDDVTPDYLRDLKKLEINRISLGVQSWRDRDLHILNRRHTAHQAEEAINEAFNTGFSNVTIDLIYGIPGMDSDEWAVDLDKSFSFGINHLSAYHLTIEQATVFGKMKEKGKFKEADEEESTTQFNILTEKAAGAGFVHYEISNFGKPGYFSVHNINYWKQVPYLGLGPSAHSFNQYSRQWNMRDLKKYIKYAGSDKQLFEKEELTLKTRFNEYIMTSLRTMWGIDLDYIERTFEKEGYDYIINLSGKFINYGLMKQDKNTLILTGQGMMISDNIISEFMMPGDNS
jgi:oxygen-independent coproporphyrinogen III oxidase